MHVGIIGAGAMGGLFGGLLVQAGHDVSFVDTNRALVETIRESGLHIERDGRDDVTVQPDITTDPATVGPVDVVLLFVKSNHTTAALRSAEPLIDPETDVVTLQNGLSNYETVTDWVGESRGMGGYTTLGANTIESGRVRQVGGGKTVFGGTDRDRVERVAEVLNEAGLESVPVADPLPHVWDKQFVNVGVKPVAALTELRNGEMVEHEDTREAIANLIEEAVAVARARGIETITDDPVAHTFDVLRDKSGKKSSILEDVERERPTEIDHINGAVVEYGKQMDVPTPYNSLAVALVRGKEAGYLA